jgi:phage terminase large subunit-like protein
MTVLMVPANEPRFPSLGGDVCDFIEKNLVFGPGDLRGQPAVLDPEKRALIWRIYEVYPEDHPLAGRRRFKRVGLSLAKGLAKTELAAWIAACELHPDAPVRCVRWEDGRPVGDGVRDPYIPMVAYTEEQSDELAYGALRAILDEGPLRNDFDIGLERIMRRRGDGKAVSLASAPSSRDGARTTFQVCDETHWWVGDRLKLAYQTMTANLPKRKLADAWMLEVTTAYEPGRNSIAEGAMDYARAISECRASDARLFYFHRQASANHDLRTEAGARAAVIEASGPAAAWRDIDGIVDLWRDPRTNQSFWERVWCNRVVKSTAQAFDITRWRSLAERDSPVQDGDRIVLGFDGSLFRDATGIVATHILTGYQWVAGIWECPANPPDDWHVPTEEVDDVVTGLFERYDVWRMYCDPAYWQAWTATWHGRYPERVIDWWTNRRQAMTRALAGYADAIAEGTLAHDGNEAFARHIANSYRLDLAQRDDLGKPLWLIQKERHDSPFKIDLAMAAVLSWQARTDAVSEGLLNPPPSGNANIWIPGVNWFPAAESTP